jgi:ABC-type branched-subunit amino acid transport system substrate-binding protein
MKKLWLLLLLPLLIPGCREEAKETVQVGVLIPLSGGLSAYGECMEDALKVAENEINDNGGVLGKDIEFIYKDTGTDPDQGKLAAQELVDEGVSVIIGAASSSVTLKVSEVTIPNSILQIAPPSTSPDITNLADNDFVFRTSPSDLFQGKIIAEYLYSEYGGSGVSSITTLFIDNSYGHGLKNTLFSEFALLGGDTLRSIPYPESLTTIDPGDVDFNSYIDSLYDINAAAVVLIAYDEGGIAVTQEAAKQDIIDWFGCDGIMTQGFLSNAGTHAEGIEGTAPYHEVDSVYDDFEERYTAESGSGPVTFIPNTYDAGILVGLAIEKAGVSDDGALIRDALREIAYDGTVVRTFAAGITAINAGTDINYDGVSGKLDFDVNGDVTAPYQLWKVVGSVFEFQEVLQ